MLLNNSDLSFRWIFKYPNWLNSAWDCALCWGASLCFARRIQLKGGCSPRGHSPCLRLISWTETWLRPLTSQYDLAALPMKGLRGELVRFDFPNTSWRIRAPDIGRRAPTIAVPPLATCGQKLISMPALMSHEDLPHQTVSWLYSGVEKSYNAAGLLDSETLHVHLAKIQSKAFLSLS